MAAESGYNNQKKFGLSQFKSIHSVGSDKFGTPSSNKILYELSATPAPIVDVVIDEDHIDSVYIEITGHGARENDVLKFMDGNLVAWEFDIIEIIDANILKVFNIGMLNGVQELPTIGDNTKIMRWVTAKGDQEGNANFSPGPTQFILDGSSVPVEMDTVTPANSKPLPAILLDDNGDPVDFTTLVPSAVPLAYANLDFSANNVDSLAYVQVLATIGATKSTKAQIFMNSGEPLLLAFGAALAEVPKIIVIPGGNGFIDLDIPANTRLSVKAINVVTVNSGNLMINLLG